MKCLILIRPEWWSVYASACSMVKCRDCEALPLVGGRGMWVRKWRKIFGIYEKVSERKVQKAFRRCHDVIKFDKLWDDSSTWRLNNLPNCLIKLHKNATAVLCDSPVNLLIFLQAHSESFINPAYFCSSIVLVITSMRVSTVRKTNTISG